MTITGKYLYTDTHVPADVKIGGRDCQITGFNMDNQDRSRIECLTKPFEQIPTDNYYGNRGITIFTSNTYSADLSLARPDDHKEIRDQFSYPSGSHKTVWLVGYLIPGKSSQYQFSLSSNGDAKLYLSSDANPNNKSLVATQNSPGTVSLQANTEYAYSCK